jgi:hypothetical protein
VKGLESSNGMNVDDDVLQMLGVIASDKPETKLPGQ